MAVAPLGVLCLVAAVTYILMGFTSTSLTVTLGFFLLGSILLNLLSNAVKFTDQGAVTVRARPTAGGAAVAITVSDTGSGMSAEVLERALEAYEAARKG